MILLPHLGMGEIHNLLERHGLQEARTIVPWGKSQRRCLEAAHGVLSDEHGRIDIAHAGFAMAALPHKKTNVSLGASMNAWLRAMNIPIGGNTYKIVREQAHRISRCRLTFFTRKGNLEHSSNGAFVRDAILLTGPDDDQQQLWQERVRLDEGFYQSLIDHPLPLREAAIREISGRSLAIDLYVWLAYRLHVLGSPVDISWPALKNQFGHEYKQIRFFRRDVQPSLQLALSVYPEAHVELDDRKGLTLYPSQPPVQERRKLAL